MTRLRLQNPTSLPLWAIPLLAGLAGCQSPVAPQPSPATPAAVPALGANVDLYRLVAPGRVGAKPPSLPLVRGGGFDGHGTIAPDGNWIAYLSGEEGQYRVWIARKDGSGARPLAPAAADSEPVWAPDAQRIAFARAGKVILVPSAGGPETVLDGPAGLRTPSFVRDGDAVLASNPEGFWRLPLTPSPAVRIAAGPGERPMEAYDRRSIYFWHEGRIHRLDQGRRQPVPLEPARAGSWTVRPSGIYFLPPGRPVIEKIEFELSRTVEMFNLPPEWIGSNGVGRLLDVSPDETWYLLARP